MNDMAYASVMSRIPPPPLACVERLKSPFSHCKNPLSIEQAQASPWERPSLRLPPISVLLESSRPHRELEYAKRRPSSIDQESPLQSPTRSFGHLSPLQARRIKQNASSSQNAPLSPPYSIDSDEFGDRRCSASSTAPEAHQVLENRRALTSLGGSYSASNTGRMRDCPSQDTWPVSSPMRDPREASSPSRQLPDVKMHDTVWHHLQHNQPGVTEEPTVRLPQHDQLPTVRFPSISSAPVLTIVQFDTTIAIGWQHHHYIARSPSSPYPFSQERYICSICMKAFSRPSSLRIHSNSHTGEKPYRCPLSGCGKRFSVRSNMKRHEKTCRLKRNRVT
jgi:uncharacterized Zn-finger protein